MGSFCCLKPRKAGLNSDIQIPLLAWDKALPCQGAHRFQNQSIAHHDCGLHAAYGQTQISYVACTLSCSTALWPLPTICLGMAGLPYVTSLNFAESCAGRRKDLYSYPRPVCPGVYRHQLTRSCLREPRSISKGWAHLGGCWLALSSQDGGVQEL